VAIPVLGTAHLFALVPPEASERLLRAALDLGFRAIDTAPSYGYGTSERAVGRAVRGRSYDVDVTTKVGIAATPKPAGGVRAAKAVARRMPAGVQRRLRGPDDGRRPPEQGRFGVREVRDSVEESLRRLRRVDRLLLHEVRVDDLTDELLGHLERYLVAGDVGQLGVATGNAHTAACIARAPELLTAVNVSISATADPVQLPASVTRRVGHGVFGAGGADLRGVQGRLRSDPSRAARWQAATVGTPWGDSAGLADALLQRALDTAHPDAVILATARVDRLARMHRVVTAGEALPRSVSHLLDSLCDSSVVA